MKWTLFLSITFLLLTCSSSDQYSYLIDPTNFKENSLTLSEIAENIKYIPLDNKMPIGLVYKLIITDDHIYLSIKDIGILTYDKSGRFICKVGSIGRGPDQYIDYMDFAVDEKNGNVFIMGPGKVKVYANSGRYIREIKYSEFIPFVGGDIDIYNSKIFIPDFLITGDSKNCWIFLDTLGNLIQAKTNSVPPFKLNTGLEGCIYKFKDKIFYYNLYNDTIFSISPDLKCKEGYLFAKGDFRWPIGKVETDAESWNKLFKPFKMFETNHFIALVYGFHNKFGLLFIEKETKNTFLAIKYNGELSEPNLVNDLDGGMSFGRDINYYAESEKEYLVQLVNPIDLKTFVSSNSFIKGIPKNLDNKVEFQKFVNTLRETDNPVLMMARLKR